MAFLRLRNPELNPRYDGIATQYMRFGEQMGIRWDYAFYQMVVETGALTHRRGSRAGDVKPEQNNFAGLGATGNGERGESFKDIESGVRAHIEHILLYAGRPVANPVAERTRKVHEWGVLNAWQRAFTRPVTYADLASKWTPTRSYASMLQAVAEHFQDAICRSPDPRPELVREARALIGNGAGAGKAPEAAPAVLALGKELVQRVFEPKAERDEGRSALGVPQPPAAPSAPTALSVPYKVPNVAPSDPQQPVAGAAKAPAHEGKSGAAAKLSTPDAMVGSAAKATGPADKSGARYAVAGVAGGTRTRAPTETVTPPAANQACRVWTASYGGQKSLIIRSVVDRVVNFTVLDVNAGSEQREAEAFIAAYAKNGNIAGEYQNQAQALDKAFELCPEG